MTWIVEHADGSATQHFDQPGTPANPAKGKRFAETPRLLAPEEDWDWSAGAIVPARPEKAAAAIDAADIAEHGAERLERAHATKALEARLILAGVPIDGWVAAEAAIAGEDVAVLAARIIAKDQESMEVEMDRRRAKMAARRSAAA